MVRGFGGKLLAGALAMVAMSGELSAQTPATPPAVPITGGIFGGKRPLDLNRVNQQLSLDLTVGEGYDEDLNAEAIGPRQTGYLTSIDGTLNYRIGTTGRFLDALLNGQARYASAGIRDMQSGRGLVRASSRLGRRMGISAETSANYQPTYLFHAFAPVESIMSDVAAPSLETSPPRGVAEQQWLALGGSTMFYRDLTSRQRAELTYSMSRRRPVSGVGFENESKVGLARHQWRLSQGVSIHGQYRFDENRQAGLEGPGRRIRYQSADLGMRWRRMATANRGFEFGAGAGATYSASAAQLDHPQAAFTSPTMWVTSGVTLSRNWSVSTDGRRAITILEGVNPEPFLTDAATAHLDGRVTKNLRLITVAGYSHGRARVTGVGEFESTSGAVELRYQRSRRFEVAATYSYYAHRLTDIVVVHPGFPTRYHLSSGRVGVTYWLPLYGSFRE